MKKYTLSELTKEVTGSNEDDYYWESKKESIRNIQRALNGIFGKYEITDSNKNQYIKIYKLMYNDDNIKALMNKQSRISKKIERKEKTLIIPTEFKNKKINKRTLTVQSDKYKFTKEVQIVILKTLLEFFREEKSELEYMLEGMIIELKSEEYNQLLDELEKEVKRINISIQGYPYEEKSRKNERNKRLLKKSKVRN